MSCSRNFAWPFKSKGQLNNRKNTAHKNKLILHKRIHVPVFSFFFFLFKIKELLVLQ